eukprot:TRINITY_DN17513_c0_g1_i1.p1 TRINITY_DN17513_c0_g1~~TRINITY_DN17513_c0_g1_i1.p1  ORF type:complete len:279 (+),score=16.01 TRINITY_DN17513_c0_g1_i1:143-979(+)
MSSLLCNGPGCVIDGGGGLGFSCGAAPADCSGVDTIHASSEPQAPPQAPSAVKDRRVSFSENLPPAGQDAAQQEQAERSSSPPSHPGLRVGKQVNEIVQAIPAIPTLPPLRMGDLNDELHEHNAAANRTLITSFSRRRFTSHDRQMFLQHDEFNRESRGEPSRMEEFQSHMNLHGDGPTPTQSQQMGPLRPMGRVPISPRGQAADDSEYLCFGNRRGSSQDRRDCSSWSPRFILDCAERYKAFAKPNETSASLATPAPPMQPRIVFSHDGERNVTSTE